MGNGRRRILAAWLGSLGLHLALLLVTWDADLLRPSDLAAAGAAAAPLELVLEADAGRDPELPTAYTDVPDRHAVETPPEDPQYLAMVNSRAADPLPGGRQDSPPGAPEASEVEQVAIRQESLAESGGVAYSGRELEARGPDWQSVSAAEAARRALADPDRRDLAADDFPLARAEPGPEREGNEADGSARQRERLPELFGGAPSILRPGPAEPSGDAGFEFDQLAAGRADGNALVQTPDFRLSTWEWDWAPWMKAFGNDLRRHWFAPYAYALGVIDGRTVVRLVVQLDGSVSKLEVQKEEGHESLHRASLAAIRAAAPFAPLPPGFPEPQLEIILTLHYPAWKAEPAPAEPAEEPEGGRGRTGRRAGR